MLARHVRSNQYRSPFNTSLPEGRLVAGEPGSLERSRQSARHVSSGFAQPRRERAVGDDGTDARQRERDRGKQMRAELAKTSLKAMQDQASK